MSAADNYPASRTFGVLIEYRVPGNAVDRSVEYVEFTSPETGGPERTLIGIAKCRIETQLLAEAAERKANKNWQIISVQEC